MANINNRENNQGNKNQGTGRKWLSRLLPIAISIMVLGALAVSAAPAQQAEASTTAATQQVITTEGSSPSDPQATVVLYDQMNNQSQEFSPSHASLAGSEYTDYTADDFVVPAGQNWNISSIQARVRFGTYPTFIGQVNVYIFLPGSPGPWIKLYEVDDIYPSSGNNDSTMVLSIAPSLSLPAGTYWLSVQSKADYWSWYDRTVLSNSPAFYSNPGGGNGTCSNWNYRFSCIGGLLAPDQMFKLSGTISGGPTNTPTRTPTHIPTATPTQTATKTPTPPASCNLQFSDVQSGNTFYSYVHCLSCRGIDTGYACGGANEPCNANNDRYYRPDKLITRDNLAYMVAASAGFNDGAGTRKFQDVAPADPYYVWIQRMANRGLIGGYPCGGSSEPCIALDNLPYYRPAANATRGQIAKIVSNGAGYSDQPVGQVFEDVPTSGPFYQWIQRLASRGVMSGYPCGGANEPCGVDNKPYFRWGNNATRGQVAKIVANTFFPNCQTP
jgi:hypothetical protein